MIQEPRFSCLSYALNLVTGEKVEILECQYVELIGYIYRVRSVIPGGIFEANENAYYSENIFSDLPLLFRAGKIGEHQYLVNVLSPFDPDFYSVMYAIDGVFRTGKRRGYFSSLIGDFYCSKTALQTGISLVMEELQNERKF